MELRDYLLIIGRAWKLIVGTTLAIVIAILVWSVLQPLRYESGATIVVNKPNTVSQRTANYYQYDKYYSIQAASLYSDTLAAWLSSPSTAREIFEKAGLPVPDVSLTKLGRIFKPRQLPPVTLSISVTDEDKAKAEKLVNASVEVLKGKTDQQNQTDDVDHYFTIISGKTVTAPKKQDLAINSLIGLIGGLILGLILAFLSYYLRDTKK